MEHTLALPNDGCFTTTTGKKVNITAPTLEMICIEDIAHALSNVCRFGGHTKFFYSVAQHSILVAHLCDSPVKNAFMAALLHDATEAYCHDVITPLKSILGEPYKAIERKFEALISEKFGIPVGMFREIKRFDIAAFEIEREYLIRNNHGTIFQAVWRQDFNLDAPYCMTPAQAKSVFLKIFNNFWMASLT